MSDVEVLNYVKAVSNDISELNKEREIDGREFTLLEGIKVLVMQRLIEPNELSLETINLLA